MACFHLSDFLQQSPINRGLNKSFMVNYKKDEYDTGLFSGINIVPFTDIILVLLIIFMVSAPGLLHSKLGITLPKTQNEDSFSHPDNISITLDKEGFVFVDGKTIEQKKLSEFIKQKIREKPKIGVTLDADQSVKHGHVITILDILRNAKIKKIYVGIQKK